MPTLCLFRVHSGKVSFEKMNENECHDYIASIINEFEKKDAAFTSVTREKRD